MSTTEQRYNFLTVGPVSWDTNIHTGLNNLSQLEEIHFVPQQIVEHAGGVALNNAAALNTLLGQIAFCGVTGKDIYGDSARSQIQEMGIDAGNLRQDLDQTSRSVVMLTNDGEKHILNDPKAMPDYHYPEEQFRDVIVKTPWAYFSVANFSRYLLPIAREYNVQTVTDLQSIDHIESKHVDHLRNANILFANSGSLKTPLPDFIKDVWSYGPSIVIVTHGPQGVTVGIKENEQVKSYKALPAEQIIDTTGAGDSFAAAFCACISQGLPVEESVTKALIFSSKKIGVQGSIYGMTSMNEINQLYEHMLLGSNQDWV